MFIHDYNEDSFVPQQPPSSHVQSTFSSWGKDWPIKTPHVSKLVNPTTPQIGQHIFMDFFFHVDWPVGLTLIRLVDESVYKPNYVIYELNYSYLQTRLCHVSSTNWYPNWPSQKNCEKNFHLFFWLIYWFCFFVDSRLVQLT